MLLFLLKSLFYLAFENERMRYSNYLWVEVEAVKPGSIYYTTKYTLK